MAEQDSTGDIRLDNYQQTGLYLILKDSTQLILTRENIEKVASEYWADPNKITPNVKEAGDFQRCSFCPLQGKRDLCDALRPVLPLLEIVDKFVSFDEVTAVYKPDEQGLLHVSNTTMAHGLRYVCLLSLMHYCQTGRKYWKYYFGTIPVSGSTEFANRLYLNIHWIYDGNKESIDKAISEFCDRVTVTTKNQVARLQLICKNDAFLNAFASVHTTTQLLNVTKDRYLKESFRRFQEI
jgi:hypothetical protein